ncbi:hypothetical protein ACB092_12G021100 [Castanea dentata]
MASMSTQKACTSSSSSSSSNPIWKYDVFLSFYGEDTRKNFTDHLYANLKQKGINTYRDNENLEQGKPIDSGLMKAIEESKYAIIVLSKNYAFSKWCLNELVKILECMKDKKLKVLPVFYHVDPSDAGNQRENFGKAFLKHEEDRKVSIEQIQKWRTALKEVSKIRGWHLLDSYESEDIQKITKSIFDELSREFPDVSENLVGINSRLKEMMNLFGTMSDEVHFIGIWGMSGIGKTTLAEVTYNRIHRQFEASSFIYNVKETSKKGGLVKLQEQLLFDTLAEKVENIWNPEKGIKMIMNRLPHKKVLIVIDDVDTDEQLQALAGSRNWFGPGSCIIITSTYRHLLKRHRLGVTIHRANGLDNDEALELFSRIVFNQTHPKTDFVNLSKDFVKYAQGLPLALEVFGRTLIEKKIEIWKDSLRQLEEIPEGEIEENIADKLEISYTGLNSAEKNLFLDIACFFKGEDMNRVAHIEGSGGLKNIDTLQEKSLITILGRRLWMHDLLQKMAWRIVHRKSPQELGRRSRLWRYTDIFHVLKYNTGKNDVEGMVLKEDLNANDDVEGMRLNLPPHKEDLNAEAFSKMRSLRLIKICNVHLPEGLNFLSNRLQMMEWHDYPLKFMPTNFQPDNLVELIMPRSHIEQLPEGFSNLAKLRLLDLRDSKVLVKTPSEINLISLEIVILSGCSSLKKFSEFGTNMTRLSELYLDGTAVEKLPSSLERLTGLTVLGLQGCKNLSSFPSVNLPSLKTLNLSGCKVQPPKSWLLHGFSLVRAAHVFFKGFFPIREAINLLLPRFRFIVSLNLADRNLWDGGLPDDLSGLSSLQNLNLSRNNFTRLPDSISQLSNLKSLAMNDCSRLQSLPDLPLSVGFVSARGCPLLEKYSNQRVVWTSGETGFTMVYCDSKDDGPFAPIRFPSFPYYSFDPVFERYVMGIMNQNKNYCELSNSAETPEWFSHQSPGSSVTIPLPSNLREDSSWIGIALFTSVVILENLNNVSSELDDKISIDFICRSDIIEVPRINCPLKISECAIDATTLFHASSFGLKVLIPAGKLKDHLEDCSCIRAVIRSKCTYFEIKMCAARVLYEQDLAKFNKMYGGRVPYERILYEQDLEKFIKMYGARGLYEQDLVKFMQAEGKIKQRSKCQIDKVTSTQSNDRLKEKLMSLLLTVYQGDLARNHKYDYVFPHMSVPDWFSNRSFCSDIRIKLPTNLQLEGRWMGIAVCAYYTVQERPVISGDNKDLTSFLNFYNPLVSHQVCLTRHRVFQESKDNFVDSSHRILVFYIPHVLLRLEECRHIGASFERNKPDVQVKECGLRLVYEQDVEKFVQTLAQCMLESPDAYHECFYQNLFHQVEEREASKDFGFSSKLQRMPRPMPILQPSIENIAEGCTSSETSPSSFTGFLATARKEQYKSIMSSQSLIKARLEKNFDEGEIFNWCFAERKIPLWFRYKNKQSMNIPLYPEFVNDPNWMGFALCGLFSYNKHPAAIRSLGSIIEAHRFSCLLRTSSCYRRLVCCGLLTTDNELVTLAQRAFIWVMFIPCTTHAHLWSKSAWAEFQLEASIHDLLVESFGVRLVFRHNMEELAQLLVQCSAPFDSFLDSCDPKLFYNVWENYPELFIGTKNSFEDLHPQRLLISQEETSATTQYSYKEYLYPHNHFRCFHPSTLYNSCFPTRRTPRWFDHHCCLGHSVTIEIPPNLYKDNNWLGLALYASILIPSDQENAISANSSHFLYCQFQMRKASLDNQILVCRTTDEEKTWLKFLRGLIWISYIPGEALKNMLHQCGHIKASFVSDWPSVMVQKCGLRLLYQHDRLQFEQQLKHCNAFISAYRDFKCEINSGDPSLERMEKCLLNKYDQRFDGHYKYSYCFPPVEILDYFNYRSNEPSVKIDLSNVFFNDSKWMGLVLCAYFSSDKHQTAIIENPNSSISHHLICILETDVAGPELGIHVHRTIKEEFTWLDTEGGFLWLCYIPCWPFLERLNQCSCIKASIISDWPGIIVKKCGLRFNHMHDNWFQKIRYHCIWLTKKQHMPQYFNDQLIARYKVKISGAMNQLSQSHLPGCDGSCDYNLCCPPTPIPHWFNIQSYESHVTFRLTRELQNRSTWLGVALCAVFLEDVGSLNGIMDSISSLKLICHVQASNGLSVKPRHIHWPTKENRMMSVLRRLVGFTWLTYIPRESFPDWLYDCASIKFSFKTNRHYLEVWKCGLRLLYQHSVEEFNCIKSKYESLGILDQKKTENINRKIWSYIQIEIRKTDTLGFDRCIFYNSRLLSSEYLDWFNHRSNETWLTIPLPPNLYNDSAWMGLVLCAYFAIDVKTTAHFDIPDSDTPFGLIYHLETNVGSVRSPHCCSLTKENLVMLQQQGGCVLLSYEKRRSFEDWSNQVSCIKASFTTDCPGLKVEKCGLRLLYHNDLEEFEQMNSPSDDLEEFEQTISHSMNSLSDDWDLIHQLTTDDVNREKQKHDGEGTSSRTSSSRKESNFGSQRGPIDPKDKGKRVLEE